MFGTMDNWILNLKEGDEVGVNDRFGRKSIEKIKRFTNTMIVLVNSYQEGKDGDRFWKRDGYRVGNDKFSYACLIPVDDKLRSDLELERKISYLSSLINHIYLKDLGIERINRIISIFKKLNNVK
jgi:hypothetical protein